MKTTTMSGVRFVIQPEEELQERVTIQPQNREAAYNSDGIMRKIQVGPGDLEELMRDIKRQTHTAAATDSADALASFRGMWSAWRASVFGTIGTMADLRLRLAIAREMTDDREARELSTRLSDAMDLFGRGGEAWTKLRDGLSAALARSKARARALEPQLAEAYQQLEHRTRELSQSGDSRCIGSVRVIGNASAAMEATLDERRELIREAIRGDRAQHTEELASTSRAMDLHVMFTSRELGKLSQQAREVEEVIRRSIGEKSELHRAACAELHRAWEEQVQRPVMELVRGTRAADRVKHETAMMDADNDPYCALRCEAMRVELSDQCSRLEAAIQDDAGLRGQLPQLQTTPWDDPELVEDRAVWREQKRAAEEKVDSRARDVRDAERNLIDQLSRSQRHLDELRVEADGLRDRVRSLLSEETGEDLRRSAAIIRSCELRQRHVGEEVELAVERCRVLAQQLEEKRGELREHDRLPDLREALDICAHAQRECDRQLACFQMATSSEQAMLGMLRAQLGDECRSTVAAGMDVIRRVGEAGRASLARIDVDVRMARDRVSEATRRIEALDRARVDQELHVTGPEVVVFTMLEKYVAVARDQAREKDRAAELEESCEAAEAARLFIAGLRATLIGMNLAR